MFILCQTSAYIKTENGVNELDSLLIKIGEGENNKALSRLYELTSTAVHSFALSILRNQHDAEDVLHDCFVAIYTSAHTYRRKSNPMAWILTITKNLCLMKMRDRKKSADMSEDNWENFIPAPEGVSAEDKMVIEACLNQLTEEERQIVILHAVSDMKHHQIASMLDLPLSTVLSKYHRALKKLRKTLIL